MMIVWINIYLIQNTFNLRNSQQGIEDVGEGCVGNGKVIEKVIEKHQSTKLPG